MHVDYDVHFFGLQATDNGLQPLHLLESKSVFHLMLQTLPLRWDADNVHSLTCKVVDGGPLAPHEIANACNS